ncbi:MAG: 3'-5' exonuclease [Succinivibrionaceae bacterium]|nr:3'-5' exonuclease [Succinivibrionaceae bacterium]
MKPLLFCDVETTGLSGGDEVLELALVDEQENVVFQKRFGTVRIKQWPQAQKIHGIKPSDVSSLPPLSVYAQELKRISKGHDIVFYNSAYDTKYMGRYLHPSCAVYCAMLTHDRLYRRRSLTSALSDHGLDSADLRAHSASGDCIATARLWKFMKNNRMFKPVCTKYGATEAVLSALDPKLVFVGIAGLCLLIAACAH